jgi:protein O-GlcNAc transferase
LKRKQAQPLAKSPASHAASALPPAEGAQLIALFNAGRHAELEARARRLSSQYPGSGFVWKVLGTALLVQNKDGREALEKAVALLPDDVEALCNLGNLQKAQGLLDEAVGSYRRAAARRPDYAAAHYNLGIALGEMGRHAEAADAYRAALNLHPAWPDAHYNLGLALYQLGQLTLAVSSYEQALSLHPDHAGAHNNLGNALKDLGQLDQAMASYRQALRVQPDLAVAHNNLGNVLRDLGRLNEAVASYSQAIRIKPDFAAAHSNLANVLRDQGKLDEALIAGQQALLAQADLPDAHNNLGNVLKDMGRLEEAMACYRQALNLDPGFASAHDNMGNLLKDMGQLEAARLAYEQALHHNPDNTDARSTLLLCLNYMPGKSPQMLLNEAHAFGELVARCANPFTHWPNERDAHKPLRVGLVSGDLCQHPVGFFLQSALTALTRQAGTRLQLFGYATRFHPDAVSEHLKANCQGWCLATGLSDLQLAAQIRRDGIDILIDLSGHTAHNRLPMFALKPAPVQVSWLGYFATTGVAAIDHLIADPFTVPPGNEAHFTEHIWRMPETRLCFSAPDIDATVSALPALANGHVTFGCFNNLSKMTDAVVALWARVLQAVPGGHLLLKAAQLDDSGTRQDVIKRFASAGIDAARLSLQGPSPRAEYLAAYHQVDIGLDPFPFTGGTTTAESLWMGVPVLTLAGERMVSRQGVSLMMNAGLPDWVALDADDYVARAVAHAGELAQLATLRAGLRQQVLASPVFDAARFAQHLEAALRGMWRQWCEPKPQA